MTKTYVETCDEMILIEQCWRLVWGLMKPRGTNGIIDISASVMQEEDHRGWMEIFNLSTSLETLVMESFDADWISGEFITIGDSHGQS